MGKFSCVATRGALLCDQPVGILSEFYLQGPLSAWDPFERSCELSLYQLLPTRVSNLFGKWITRRYKGKLQSVLQRKDDGRHVFRFHWKDSLLKQYHKELQPPVLRNELASNYLYDLGLRKSLKYLPEIKEKFSQIVDRFADFQAATLSVPPEWNLSQPSGDPGQDQTCRYQTGTHARGSVDGDSSLQRRDHESMDNKADS